MSLSPRTLLRSDRGSGTSAQTAEKKQYTLAQRVPEPLSRLALQRMRRPADDDKNELAFVHMKSETFKRIHYELMRYCRGEIDGLSVLIAGQRGAGKTTLTKLLIQEVMRDSDALIPLPLFLHGPTIIDASAITTDSDDKELSAPQEKERALRQIITALYRSLSSAIYDAWLTAAEETSTAGPAESELLGLRAHLDLRLERAPDADVLRKIWDRAGFMYDGVAFYLRPRKRSAGRWTRNFRPPPVAGNEDDQGLREIVALSACADAYRVILGKTEETLQSAQSAERAQESRFPSAAVEGKAEAQKSSENAKEKAGIDKVGPPALGLITGAGVASAITWAEPKILLGLAVGVCVWLLSWAAMSYGVRRSKQESRRELRVNVNWDIDRLERDLPILLRRVKDAGFAPIFVLDELDKARDASAALDKFLTLTKHIVTDQAAFLFLTNRDYYERLITSENVDVGYAS